MSDQDKIWFIYLTDHHEGPFTVAEIAEKAQAGLVNGQSLAWKDGMAEWVAAETIPELQGAVAGGGGGSLAVEASPAAGGAEEEGGPSLAQLLAQSQQGAAPAVESTGGSVVADVSPGGGEMAAEPGPNQEVWTLRTGSQVSGLYSMNKLKSLASAGEIPPEAGLWHPGWSDFRSISAVPELEALRKQGVVRAGTRSGLTARPGAMMSAAPDRDDEPTDTGIRAPKAGLAATIAGLINRFRAPKKAAPKKAAVAAAKPGFGAVKRPVARGGAGGAAKRVLGLLVVLLAVAGVGGGAYFLFFNSPIPSSLDVNEGDREQMVEVVKDKAAHRLYLATAQGDPDNPADPTSPKYYVATNLPEGTQISLQVTGVPGTLVNRVAFDKTFTAAVEKHHVATFEGIRDEGKPLWGEFNFKLTAEGADPLEVKGKFIGNKGPAYQKRLKMYKDSVQGDYDQEITELREYVATLKNLQNEANKQIAAYKTGWAQPAMRAKITAEWTNLARTAPALLSQLGAKVKERQAGEKAAKYHARAFQDVATTVGQLEQLLKAHGERLAGTAPSANPDELDGLVQAGVLALEAWLAQAVTKDPFSNTTPAPPPPAAPAPAPAAAPPPAVKP